MLLFAAGRGGATDRLNLDADGITVDHRGRIEVDALTLQTSVPPPRYFQQQRAVAKAREFAGPEHPSRNERRRLRTASL